MANIVMPAAIIEPESEYNISVQSPQVPAVIINRGLNFNMSLMQAQPVQMFKLPNFEKVLTLVDDVAGVFDTIPGSIEDAPDFEEPDNYYLKVVEGFFAQQNDQTFGHSTSEQ